MTTQQELHRVAYLIESEATILRSFLALLEREEAMLVAGDADSLLVLTQEKTECYRQLQRLHDDRALLLGRMRLPNTDATIRELCRSMPETVMRWDEILASAREARTRNEINGKLITERMQHNQAALSVLLTAADKPQLYDAGGMARPSGSGRHLGSA